LRDAPPSNLLPGIVRSPFDRDRERSLSIREVDPIDRPGWTFMTSRHYGSNTYSRTSATLRSLERHLGRDVLDRGLRIYAARQRYRHPVAEDLFDALSEAAGRNLRPLLHHLFREPLRHDAMVQSVKVHRVGDEKGWFEAAGGGRELRVGSKDEEDKDENGDSGDGGEQRFRVDITLRRTGRPPFPVTGSVELADGTALALEPWDGATPWTHRVLFTGSRPVKVLLDPKRVDILEGNRGNDGWRKKADRRAGVRWGGRALRWIQSVLFTAGSTP
jgi:hypothetical protein